MNSLAATALGLSIQARSILDDVTFRCAGAEFVGLIGPNGAGKSTLLKALAGLNEWSCGNISIGGDDIRTLGRGEIARRVAYLAQDETVHWPLDVATVVALGRIPHGRGGIRQSRADRAAVERAMEKTGVRHMRARNVLTLSGGERARVLLARALAVEAAVLLVDEPLSALDPYHSLNILDLLRAEVDRGTLVIAVLHDLTAASRFCDRLIMLNEGRILADGPAGQVLRSENIARSYGVTAYYGQHDGQDFVVPWRPGRAPQPHGESHV